MPTFTISPVALVRTLWRHRLSVAIGVPVVLFSGVVYAITPQSGSNVWPEPQVSPTLTSRRQASAPVQTVPTFRAPSAKHCARPIQTREVPGRTGQDGSAWREMELGSGRMEEARVAARAKSRAVTSDEMVMMLPVAASTPAATAPAAMAPTTGAAQSESLASTPALKSRAKPVTAGMVDDNANFSEYLAFRERTQVPHLERDVRERHLLAVRDAQGRGVADAEVLVRSAQGQAMWARTDTQGRAWIHPNAFDPGGAQVYDVVVRKNGVQTQGYLQRGQKSAVELTLSAAATRAPARLDLVFLIDATGSMGDEIDKLKASLQSIASEVAQLPSRPDLCLGLVAYRDKGDQFLLRSHDFTNNLNAFQGVLNALQADGGGDYPEAMNEALHETVHQLSWRGNGTTRMVVLLADAPPHLDYGGPRYDDDMLAALGKGIKVFTVGASGLDQQGEYIQRQIAQYTGGRFVFLTYADANQPSSGPGRETLHDVSNYSVQTLDRLIVRLVRDELASLQP